MQLQQLALYRTLHLRGFVPVLYVVQDPRAGRGMHTLPPLVHGNLLYDSTVPLYSAVLAGLTIPRRAHHNNALSRSWRPASLTLLLVRMGTVQEARGPGCLANTSPDWLRGPEIKIVASDPQQRELWAQELPCGGPPAQHGIRREGSTCRAWGPQVKRREERACLLWHRLKEWNQSINQGIRFKDHVLTPRTCAAGKRSLTLSTLLELWHDGGYAGPHRLSRLCAAN